MTNSTVYLLDDEETLLDLHCEIVEMVGFTAKGYTRASTFFDEVEQFETGSIMLLDLQMPEMDGIQVMRKLATMQQPPALILISGHDVGVLYAAEKLCHAHGLEVLASLRKPVAIDALQELLEKHIPTSITNDVDIQHSAEKKLTLNDLLDAIKNETLELYFQPQVNIDTGALYGVEALVRWNHPEMGLLNLEKFISLAEKSGSIGNLTRWVIDSAISQQLYLRQAGFDIKVSVNISATDITSLELPERLAELLEENKLEANRLTLEVTESALMGELVTSLDILTRLRLKGIGLSIDDFGTGYSSLSQLHRVPFTELKIDRSFVSAIDIDDEACAIVKTCIVLGHELKMHVVAEGVETDALYQALKYMGCDVAQGYFIAKPMPVEKLVSWLQTRK